MNNIKKKKKKPLSITRFRLAPFLAVLIATHCCIGLYTIHTYLLDNTNDNLVLQIILTNKKDNFQINPSASETSEIKPHRDGLASCLLIKDDNFLLQEWLAYHWMQGMQYLIVAQDPTSKMPSDKILRTWGEMTGMEIILWNDPDYHYEIPQKTSIQTIHQLRQKYFLVECLRHHKAKGRSWVFHIDTDEYITSNVAFGSGQGTILRQGQNLWQYLTKITNNNNNNNEATPYRVDESKDNNICIHVPRLTFSAKEEKDDERMIEHHMSPIIRGLDTIDPKLFQTMRFIYHANPKKKKHNKLGKFLLNLDHIPFGLINRGDLFSIHRPFIQFCGPAYQYDESLPFMIHHYIGSWEQYSYRGDLRRTRANYDEKAYHVYNKTTHIQGWLSEFVAITGVSNASKLLDEVGIVRQIRSNDRALFELPGYPESRGSDESYQRNEYNLSTVKYFDANGEMVELHKVSDESSFAKNENFNHTTYTGLYNKEDKRDSTCALIFFGIGRSFEETTLPTIKKYVIEANRSCKVFVHTYKGDSLRDAKKLSSLTYHDSKAIIIEREKDFKNQRNTTYFHQFFPTSSKAWKFPRSMDNMIRQWHSINKAWDLMVDFENQRQLNFDRVGFFRPDVLYTHPISIEDEDELAVIPSMTYKATKWIGFNDRMFYGSREFAEIWASHRFDNVEKYIQWQESESLRHNDIMHNLRGLHSENFIRYLLTIHGRCPLKFKNICFKRVRSNGKIFNKDCNHLRSHDDGNAFRNGNKSNFKSDEADLMSRWAPGVILLGMHRSGTSMLAGLLSSVFSMHVPRQQVTASNYKSQNSKGFFENFDVVRQNDEWLKDQDISWDKLHLFTVTYNGGKQKVLGRFKSIKATQAGIHGQKALEVYNNATNTPWVLNDPRMCLTLDVWTQLLKSDFYEPPILFTYRNPLEVAMSLQARKRNSVSLLDGLRLWIWYNREAIRLSRGMCRIVTR